MKENRLEKITRILAGVLMILEAFSLMLSAKSLNGIVMLGLVLICIAIYVICIPWPQIKLHLKSWRINISDEDLEDED